MPSRSPSISPVQPPYVNHHRFVTPLTGGVVAAFSILLAFTLCFRKLSRKRTVPSNSKPPHPFSYADLRAATSSFSAANRVGQGGFGSVYRGTLSNNQQVAVKVMDAGSLQGEREFQNELFFAGNVDCSQILSVIGFSSDRKRRRMLLVYELMSNGSLQDCLLHRKCTELKDWKKRISIAVDIAKGLEYLHHCDPPVVHGDIKPSNILLNASFNAKIGDFGLARVKSEDQCVITVNSEFEGRKDCNSVMAAEDNGSVIAETESVTTTCYEEFNVYGEVHDLPESSLVVKAAEASPDTVIRSVLSPETTDAATASPATVLVVESQLDVFDKGSVSEANFDGLSMESGKESGVKKNRRGKKSFSGKDWWWKQDNTGAEAGPVKDYVMEWIGTEIKKERPKSEWITAPSLNSDPIAKSEQKKKKKSNKRRLDWWVSLDEEKIVKKEKRRPAREWWKEEYCEELARKNKKKKKKEGLASTSEGISYDNYWPTDEDSHHSKKKNRRRSRSRGSLGSVDWWLDGLSGELWRGRHNSHDFSGDIHKSGGISSTPSMRGTVCYVAPEYSGGDNLSEKCDVYSFGVLLLVVISGRRPLQVSGSPMSEFQRANLLSWSRHLARAGKLIDLVDQSVESVNKEEALMSITVALLCLQRSPALRPSMKEVVSMLSGEVEPPHLPAELSPSRFAMKYRKKVR